MKEGDVMKWFRLEDLKDVNMLRTAYKKLLIKYHPDNNAKDTTGIMQEINAEYDLLFQKLKDTYEHSESYEKQTDRQKQVSIPALVEPPVRSLRATIPAA